MACARTGDVDARSFRDMADLRIQLGQWLDSVVDLRQRRGRTCLDRFAEEKSKLEQRLRLLENSGLESSGNAIGADRPRRPYPKVLPKYQNPKNPAEKWSGRGKQPHWVQAQLKAGKKLEGFLIAR